MTKNLVVTAIVALIVTALYAQTPTHGRIQTVPNTKAPTKVTGDGIKTDFGLAILGHQGRYRRSSPRTAAM